MIANPQWHDPDWRAVSEDWAHEHGRWTEWRAALDRWLMIDRLAAYIDTAADADAAYADTAADAYVAAYAYVDADAAACTDADADADAYIDTDAYADAYAYADAAEADADAEKQKLLKGGEFVKPGLYLFATPSGYGRAVLRVGWLRRAPEGGDEYELHGSRTPLRPDYSVTFDEAQHKPPKSWSWTKPLDGAVPYTRHQIQTPVPLNVKGYADLCPAPEWAREMGLVEKKARAK